MATKKNQVTIKGIESVIEALCATDPRISSYRYADFFETDTKVEDVFPLVMHNVDSISIEEKNFQQTNRWKVSLYCFTQRMEDWSNATDAASECQVILSDLILKWKQDEDLIDVGFVFDRTVTIEVVNKIGRDDLIGVRAILDFTTPLHICDADLPMGQLPDLGLYYSASTITSNPTYLTCATLTGCSVIQTIQSDIEQLFLLTGSTSFDCGVLSGCSTIQSIQADILALYSGDTQIRQNYLPLTGGTLSNSLWVPQMTALNFSSGTTDLNDYFSSINSRFSEFLLVSGGTGGPYQLTGQTDIQNDLYLNDVDHLPYGVLHLSNSNEVISNSQFLYSANTLIAPISIFNQIYLDSNYGTGNIVFRMPNGQLRNADYLYYDELGGFSSLSLSGGTIYSGGTDLSVILASLGGGVVGNFLPLSGGTLTGSIDAVDILSGGTNLNTYFAQQTLQKVTEKGNSTDQNIIVQSSGFGSGGRKLIFRELNVGLSGATDFYIGQTSSNTNAEVAYRSGSLSYIAGTTPSTDLSSFNGAHTFTNPALTIGRAGFDFYKTPSNSGATLFIRSENNSQNGTTYFINDLATESILRIPLNSGRIAIQEEVLALTGGTLTGQLNGTVLSASTNILTPALNLSSDVLNPHYSILFKDGTDVVSGSTNFKFNGTNMSLNGGVIYGQTLSGGTIYSGGSDLSTYFSSIIAAYVAGDTQIRQNYLPLSGGTISGNISATNITGTTFFSGTTPLNTILSSLGGGVATYVQNGWNTLTGGTPTRPTVNLVDSPVVNALNFSGNIIDNSSNFETGVYHKSGGRLTSTNKFVYDTTGTLNITQGTGGLYTGGGITGATFYSGTTPFNTILAGLGGGSGVVVAVAEGANIVTGGTQANPTVGVVASPSFTNVSATTIYSGSSDLSDVMETAIEAQIEDDFTTVQKLLGSQTIEQTFGAHIQYANTATALTDAQIRFFAVYLHQPRTLSGITIYTRVQGNFTADAENSLALYSYDGGTGGLLTRRAISSNNGNHLKGTANAFLQVPFTSTYVAPKGLYYVGILYNNSAQTTAPSLASIANLNNAAMSNIGYANSAKLYMTLAAQTAQPATLYMSGLTGSNVVLWGGIY